MNDAFTGHKISVARDHIGWFWVDWMTEQCRHDAVEDEPDTFRFPDGGINIDLLDAYVPRAYFARIGPIPTNRQTTCYQ